MTPITKTEGRTIRTRWTAPPAGACPRRMWTAIVNGTNRADD